MKFSEFTYRKIDKEIAKFPPEQRQSATLASLAIVQEERNWLSEEVLEEVANYLNISVITVWEVASFYRMFNLEPIGKYKISLCTNLPCALRGAEKAAQHLKRKLGIDYGETTQDGQFTLIEGECMGACADSPVLIVNNHRMFAKMNPEELEILINGLLEEKI